LSLKYMRASAACSAESVIGIDRAVMSFPDRAGLVGLVAMVQPPSSLTPLDGISPFTTSLDVVCRK
jgi:hypothetical protein